MTACYIIHFVNVSSHAGRFQHWVTKLKTINKFCTPRPDTQQYKSSSERNKIYSTKKKLFLFHYSKIQKFKNSVLAEKNRCVVPKH